MGDTDPTLDPKSHGAGGGCVPAAAPHPCPHIPGESGLGKSTLVNSLFLTDMYRDRKLLNAEGEGGMTVPVVGYPAVMAAPSAIPRGCSPCPCPAGLLWVSEAACGMLPVACWHWALLQGSEDLPPSSAWGPPVGALSPLGKQACWG